MKTFLYMITPLVALTLLYWLVIAPALIGPLTNALAQGLK